MATSAVHIIWKCTKPKNAHLQSLYEGLMTQAAHAHGMDTAVIRAGIHSTTRINGHYVKSGPHMTGDIVNTKKNVGFALHWNFTDTSGSATVHPTATAPNPQLWELMHKDGKGFILVNGDEEEVHPIE